MIAAIITQIVNRVIVLPPEPKINICIFVDGIVPSKAITVSPNNVPNPPAPESKDIPSLPMSIYFAQR